MNFLVNFKTNITYVILQFLKQNYSEQFIIIFRNGWTSVVNKFSTTGDFKTEITKMSSEAMNIDTKQTTLFV